MLLLSRVHALKLVFEPILTWSLLSAMPWLAGALVPSSLRYALWRPALAVDLVAPLLGYWTPRLGRSLTNDYAVEGGHFAERFQPADQISGIAESDLRVLHFTRVGDSSAAFARPSGS